jgi:hypothetical protein
MSSILSRARDFSLLHNVQTGSSVLLASYSRGVVDCFLGVKKAVTSI